MTNASLQRVAVALAVALLAATPASPAKAPIVLSAQNAQTLPDTALVMVHGKSVALGTLRAAHAARLERFSRAASLAQSYRLAPSQLAGRTVAVLKTQAATKPVPPVPNAFSASGVPVPVDLKAFCTAAATTACLYLPASQNWGEAALDNKPYWVDSDPLIFEPAVCTQDGGRMTPGLDECEWFYPEEYLSNFTTTATPNNPLTFTLNCQSPMQNNVDPRGAIEILITVPPTTTAATCLIDAIEPAK